MTDEIIAIIVIVLIIGAALFYIIKAKKSGRKCIGCPNSGSCSHANKKGNHNCGDCCGCSHNKK